MYFIIFWLCRTVYYALSTSFMLCSWNYSGKSIENSWTGPMEKIVAS